VHAAVASGVLAELLELLDVVEVTAPRGGPVGFLQGHHVGSRLAQQAGDLLEVLEDGARREQRLVGRQLAAVRDVESQQADRPGRVSLGRLVDRRAAPALAAFAQPLGRQPEGGPLGRSPARHCPCQVGILPGVHGAPSSSAFFSSPSRSLATARIFGRISPSCDEAIS
jgi:hypothetical protein